MLPACIAVSSPSYSHVPAALPYGGCQGEVEGGRLRCGAGASSLPTQQLVATVEGLSDADIVL